MHTFIERVVHSMSCIRPGFAHVLILVLVLLRLVLSCFQSTFSESSRHMLEWVVTTWSSRGESSTFCTLWHPSVLLLVGTISASACVESSVLLHDSRWCRCIGHGWSLFAPQKWVCCIMGPMIYAWSYMYVPVHIPMLLASNTMATCYSTKILKLETEPNGKEISWKVFKKLWNIRKCCSIHQRKFSQ